jgi:uncharacterized membrane protein YdbT with pleckstrin-like domain
MVSTEAESCPKCGAPNPTTRAADGAAASQVAPRAAMTSPSNMTMQESPVYQAHVHWIVYMKAILVALLGVVILIITQYDGLAPYAGIGVLAVALVLGVIAMMQARSTEFVITTRRLIAKRGIASRRTIETLLEKVEAVTVEQNLWGRVFGYGKVTVIGTGGTNETFALVGDPMKLRQVIHEQIDKVR